LRPRRIFGVFRAQGTCLLAANVVLPHWGANSTPQIPSLDLRGHFDAEEIQRKADEAGEKNRKKGTKSTGGNTP